MKRILLSVLTIAAVSAIGVAATRAFFSDVETSSGNTFQAGTLDLEISSQCTYNGIASNQCGTWEQRDLSPTADKFFNFTDLKPGDWGENTIDFKILTNDAWMCANINFTQHQALADYLNVFWWIDADGNNQLGANEKVLYDGPRTIAQWITAGGGTGSLPLTFADSYLNWETWTGGPSGNTTPIPGNTTKYLGVGWCFGSLALSAGNGVGFTCNGGGSDQNLAQGTSIVADLTFTVEQYRNNSSFLCPEHRPAAP